MTRDVRFTHRPEAKPIIAGADTLLDNLTVYEQLLYTSELKNSQKESLARKKTRVEVVISQLSMESCKNVTIGSAMKRGISGVPCNYFRRELQCGFSWSLLTLPVKLSSIMVKRVIQDTKKNSFRLSGFKAWDGL